MQIYTTGGGYFVEQILIYLALFHASNDFDVMMLIAIMAGITTTSVILLFGMTFQKFLQNFIMTLLAGSFMVGGTVSVDVHDKTYGTLSYYSTVDNVPRGVAYLAHYTTGVSYHITETMELLLSTPTDLAYQKNGISFGASLMAQQARWRAINSVVNERIVEFMQKCMVRANNLGYFPTDVIAHATDIEAAVTANLPASLSYYDNKTKSVQSCTAGWTDIQTDVTAEVTEILKHQAASAYQRNPGVDGAATVTNLTNTLTAFQNYVGASSSTASTTVKQAMLVNAFDDGLQRYAALSGNDASLSNLTNTIADAQRRSANASIGLFAGKYVPYLKIIFECIYYGLFPFAVMMLFTPLNWAVIKGYCGGFVWLATWEPASAVLHGVVLWASSGFYRNVGIQTTDGMPTDVAMTWANHFGFIAVEQDIGAFAGSMMMMVPFITTVIFFSARGMTQLATSMLNVGQGTAIEAGRSAATGNVSLSNASMNNMTGNQWTTSPKVDAGRWQAVGPTGAIIGQNADLTTYHGKGTATPDVTMSVSGRNALSTELSERAEASRTAAITTGSETSEFLSEATSQYSTLMSSASQTATLGHQRSTGTSQEDSESLREAQRVVDSAASSEGINSDLVLRAGLAANMGLSKGDFLKLGASLDGGAGMQAISNENYRRAWDVAQSEEVQRALSSVERVGETSTWGSAGTYGDSANTGERFSMDDGERMASTYARQLREADAYSKAASDVQSSSVVSDTQLGVFVQRALEDQGLSKQQVSDILTARDFGALAKQDAILEEVVSDMMFHYGVGGAATDRTRGFDASAAYKPEAPSPLPNTVGPIRDNIVHDAQGTTARMDDAADRIGNGQTVSKEGFDGHWETNKAMNAEGQDRSLRETNQARTRDLGRQVRDGVLGDSPEPAKPSLSEPMPFGDDANALPGGNYLAPTPPAPSWLSGSSQQGFFQASNISYDLGGKVRSQPPQPELIQNISGIASELGPDVGVVVRSAGQPSFGSDRVGSPRHDHGHAVDIQLTKGGEPLKPSENPALYSAFIERAAAQNPGIGHYDWGLHIGGGAPAFWGPDTTSATADPAFKSAYERGRNS